MAPKSKKPAAQAKTTIAKRKSLAGAERAKAKPAARGPAVKRAAARVKSPRRSPQVARSRALAAPPDETLGRELEAARAAFARVMGELMASRADGERFQADHERADQRARDQQVELERLRAHAEQLADVQAIAQRNAEDAIRRADEAAWRMDELTRAAETAARRADELTARLEASAREHERLVVALTAARAELEGYPLRCAKCGERCIAPPSAPPAAAE